MPPSHRLEGIEAAHDALHLSLSSVEKYVTATFGKLGLDTEPHRDRRILPVLTFLREGQAPTG